MSGRADHIRLALDLPRRQQEVLRLIACGLTCEAVGYEIGVKAKTVEFHRKQLMNKTHLNSTAELTRLAVRLGMVNVNP
jgi:two-component system response regulator NreC